MTQATFDIRGSGSGAAGGGHATAIIPLRPGETVQVNVGGLPHGATGGFNGGGDSQISPGGGATDIRIGGTSLNDRALVAGGGGGGMSPPPMLGGPGAAGGGGGGLYGNTFTRSLGQGPNSVPLSDALIKTLKPQRYTLEAVATDASKQRSDTAVARFRIPKP